VGVRRTVYAGPGAAGEGFGKTQERAVEIGWVLNHQEDLAADFRVFYRLTPKKTARLSGPEYLQLAYRVSAYRGVMRELVLAEQEEQAQEEKTVEPTRAAVEATPGMAGLIDWG
jgi:hypothetical protein